MVHGIAGWMAGWLGSISVFPFFPPQNGKKSLLHIKIRANIYILIATTQ